MRWTAEDDALLTKMHAKNMSFGEMAEQLGRTKNSCVGRAHRLRLPMREHAIKGRIKIETKAKPIAAEHCMVSRKKPKVEQSFQQQDMGFAEKPKPDPGSRHLCQWIFGDPRENPDDRCGKPVRPGTPWCEYHFIRVYRQTGVVEPEPEPEIEEEELLDTEEGEEART